MPEMLKGAEYDVEQTTDPVTNWARKVSIAVAKRDELGKELFPSDITRICQAVGIVIHGATSTMVEGQLNRLVGQWIAWLAKDGLAEVPLGPYTMRPVHAKMSRNDGRGKSLRWVVSFGKSSYEG